MKRKNSSIKLFYRIAKRAYNISKEKNLGWKWRDAQKWTSKNIYPKFKNRKSKSTIKNSEIDKEIDFVLLKFSPPANCYNPFDVASYLLDSIEWWDLDDKVSILNDDLLVNLDLEYNGKVFAKTGVIKKSFLPNLKEVREEMRDVTNKSGFYPPINFYIVLKEGQKDDRSIPCNYYVLITFENSNEFMAQNSKGLIKNVFVSSSQMPIDEKERIALLEKQKEEEKRITAKQKVSAFKLPSKVEPPKKQPKKAEPTPTEPKGKPTEDELKTIRWQEFNKAKESYRRDLDEGLISKKDYKKIILELTKKLERGGTI